MLTKTTIKRIKSADPVRPDVHPHAKLTEKDVLAIRRVWAKSEHPSMTKLAAWYKVSVPTISHIVYGFTWQGVGLPSLKKA